MLRKTLGRYVPIPILLVSDLTSRFGRYLKSGLINMEGPRHRLVRKICQPLFSQQNIRNMMPVFLEKGEQVRLFPSLGRGPD